MMNVKRKCELCGKTFIHDRQGGRPKYCPACRERYADIYREQRTETREAKHKRKAGRSVESSPEQGIQTVLQDLERFNAARRAAGKPIVTYGKYVAIRDKRMPDRDHP